MNPTRILVVDDEPQLRRVMRTSLTTQGYDVVEARTGEDALERMRTQTCDLVLLDVNMPGMGGLAACRAIRASSDISIIMLTVRNTENDKVEALDAGADDYVTKPFGTPELLARVRAALRRRTGHAEPERLTLGDIEIDFQARHVMVRNQAVRFTPKEFELLRYLVTHPNQPIAHRELLGSIWGPEYGDQVEYLRVFMNQLRKKIEPDPANPRYLLTEPWFGYCFRAP
ncbi:MAG: response regulator transcription factor [Vicinamibacterales bacterium]